MHIRLAGYQDFSVLTQLAHDLFELHAGFDPQYYLLEDNFNELFSYWLKDQLITPNTFIFVAIENEQVVGFISGFIKALYPWFKTKAAGHISFMIVDKQYRQRGVGHELEKTAINWFKSRNIHYIDLYVEEKNDIGKKAWYSYGFFDFKRFLRKKF